MWMDYLRRYGDILKRCEIQPVGLGLFAAYLASYWLNSNMLSPMRSIGSSDKGEKLTSLPFQSLLLYFVQNNKVGLKLQHVRRNCRANSAGWAEYVILSQCQILNIATDDRCEAFRIEFGPLVIPCPSGLMRFGEIWEAQHRHGSVG